MIHLLLLGERPSYKHIVLDNQGVALIADTPIKVIELVQSHLAYGWSPAELHFQFPHLSLGQIHSALAYYRDHKQELDQEIERRTQRVEQIRSQTPVPPIVERLRTQRSHS